MWPVTGTPAVATVVFGLGAAFAAMFISLTVLVEMMSIGEPFCCASLRPRRSLPAAGVQFLC